MIWRSLVDKTLLKFNWSVLQTCWWGGPQCLKNELRAQNFAKSAKKHKNRGLRGSRPQKRVRRLKNGSEAQKWGPDLKNRVWRLKNRVWRVKKRFWRLKKCLKMHFWGVKTLKSRVNFGLILLYLGNEGAKKMKKACTLFVFFVFLWNFMKNFFILLTSLKIFFWLICDASINFVAKWFLKLAFFWWFLEDLLFTENLWTWFN